MLVTNELIRQIEINYRNWKKKWYVRLGYISTEDVLLTMWKFKIGFLCPQCFKKKFGSLKEDEMIYNYATHYCCKIHRNYYRAIADRFVWDIVRSRFIEETMDKDGFKGDLVVVGDKRVEVIHDDTIVGICRICGHPVKYEDATIDHIKPIRDGGLEFDWDNLRLAHRWCNSRNQPMKVLRTKNYQGITLLDFCDV